MLNLNKKFLLFPFLLSLFSTFLFAEIQQVNSLSAIEAQIDQLDKNTLVVFDVDEVLFTDQDAVLKPLGDPLKFQIFNERYAKAQTEAEKDLVTSILSLPLQMAKRELVEDSTPGLIQKLQSQSVKCLALTSCPTRPFGVIKDFEQWRLNQLKEFKIDFSTSFSCKKKIVFEKLTSFEVPPPVYNRGVLFAEGFSKADVLCHFLDLVSFTPKKVIFIDDMYSNLQQMEQKMAQKKIPFQGYYYVKVQQDSRNNLDERVARFQFDYLFNNLKWLSDKEALKKMKQKN